MSEENQVFRADRGPEPSKLDPAAATSRAAAPAVRAAASFSDDRITVTPSAVAPAPAPVQAAPTAIAPASVSAANPAATPAANPASPAPELKFEVDASQLWHAPEALARRIANLQSTSAATSHLLDEQEAETRRIEQQLKSL